MTHLLTGAILGYGAAVLIIIPGMFIWAEQWERKVRSLKRRMRRDEELEAELDIGDKALVRKAYQDHGS